MTSKNEMAPIKNKPQPPAVAFRATVTKIAGTLLNDWVGDKRAGEAVGRVASALSAAAATARNPADFYKCTPQSVGSVIAISALTGIMPSTGATSLAYAIPRRPRKGEDPQLQYQLSHRGINALAQRCGLMMVPVPIGVDDVIDITPDGDVQLVSKDLDNPPDSEEDLRGIMLVVKDNSTGTTLFTGWVPKKLINKRREGSDSYQYAVKNAYAQRTDPWHQWYVEMAMKTAMHYAVSRGWCVIDDTASVRALSVDSEADLVKVEQPTALPAPESPFTELNETSEPEEGLVNETSEPVNESLFEEESADQPVVVSVKDRLVATIDQAKGVPELEQVMQELAQAQLTKSEQKLVQKAVDAKYKLLMQEEGGE